MKIALVTEFFYPTMGGTQTAVASIANSLGSRGHHVTVLAPLSNQGPWPPQPGGAYTTRWLHFRPWPLAGYLAVQWAIRTRLAPFDVIHLFHPAFGLGVLWAARRSRKRLVVTLMGYDTYGFAAMPWIKQQITLAVCRRADTLTAPSNDLARLARQTGVTREIEIIPHGVTPVSADPSHVVALRRSLKIKAGQITFVAVQRHYPVKEPLVFLEAWQRLARPDCRLILVGGGELESLLRQRIAELGLTNVTLTGEVPREEVPSYLALADVFVHHSRYESFGLGVLEAMQAGLPVIACNVGAVPEVVTDGAEGLLIPPSDPEAMAAAAVRLADSPELRARLAAAARERATQFAWDHLASRYEKLYRGEA